MTRRPEVIALAKLHFDVMLDFSAASGYFASMASFSGPDLGKTNTGAWAATAWFQGCGAEVKAYCVADVDLLHSIVSTALVQGALSRTTKAGTTRRHVLAGAMDGTPRFRTVDAALAAYCATPPDVSWMTAPPDIGALFLWANS